MSVKAALITKPGGRRTNEDYAAFSERGGYGCYAVADGLSAYMGGDLASRTACESVLEAFRKSPGSSSTNLFSYLEYASQAMNALKKKLGTDNGLKTTLVVLLTGDYSATWAHIGNSRLYYFKAGKLAFQTKDQSLPQHLVDIGEITPDKIRFHEDHSRLIHVFDGGDIKKFAFLNRVVQVSPGDAIMLCSDGFWEYVYENEMTADLAGSGTPEEWIARMEQRLLRRAKENNDNYAALTLRFG